MTERKSIVKVWTTGLGIRELIVDLLLAFLVF